jgi:predicted MFS family arabinose efflux permease
MAGAIAPAADNGLLFSENGPILKTRKQAPMPHRRLKPGYFCLEAINAFAVAYYFNYLFFYLQKEFGFGNLGNLTFSALNGFVYIFASVCGGRFAQKHGYFLALNLGFIGMIAALVTGILTATALGQLLVLLLWTVAVCFTWPTLEALVTEGADVDGLPRLVGIYNMVWASAAALAFFSGGALLQLLGWKSLFWLPALLHLVQLGLANWLAKQHGRGISHYRLLREQMAESAIVVGAGHAGDLEFGSLGAGSAPAFGAPVLADKALGLASRARSAWQSDGTAATRDRSVAPIFLRMAWAANPLAYMAINTALPLMPDIAKRLELSPMSAGFVCSVWTFARLGAFLGLWRWVGWHYRFGWLLSAYLLLIFSFAGLLLTPSLSLVVVAQLGFGCAIGLIYYSSLFYSMDASDTKGVHGGLHEAAIGVGICTGPALGAVALGVFPDQSNASAWAVSGLLVLGLMVLGVLRRQA